MKLALHLTSRASSWPASSGSRPGCGPRRSSPTRSGSAGACSAHPRRPRPVADRPRRPRRRVEGGSHLQHLAADGRAFVPRPRHCSPSALDRKLRRQRHSWCSSTTASSPMLIVAFAALARLGHAPGAAGSRGRPPRHGDRRPDAGADGPRHRRRFCWPCRSGPAWRIRSSPWPSSPWPSPMPA